jgi:DNA polymerase-1
MPKLPMYQPAQAATLLPPTPTTSVYDETCTRCSRHSVTKTVCIKPTLVRVGDSDKNRVLLLADRPTKNIDMSGRAFSDGAQHQLVSVVKNSTVDGTFLFDYAVRCYGDANEIEPAHTLACAGATTLLYREFAPHRIIAMGRTTIAALTGRSIDPHDVRGGWSPLIDADVADVFGVADTQITPVYFMPDFSMVANNRFLRADFVSDLHHAITRPLPSRRELAHVYGELFYVDVKSPKEASAALSACQNSGVVSFDCETQGQIFDSEFRVRSIAFTTDADETFVFDGDAVPMYASTIRSILSLPSPKVGHNVKYDAIACKSDPSIAMLPVNAYVDTRLMRKLVEPTVSGRLEENSELIGFGGHKAEAQEHIALVKRELNAVAKYDPTARTPTGRLKSPPKLSLINPVDVTDRTRYLIRGGVEPDTFAYGLMSPDIRTRYNARDAYTTYRLYNVVRSRETPQSRFVYEKITQPALRALTQMESWGLPIDKSRVEATAAMLQTETRAAKARLDLHGELNWNSPKQIAHLLYDKLGLPVIEYTESGTPGTGKEVLEELAKRGNQVAKDLINYRKLSKLDSVYATGMLPHIRFDGRVYPSFLLDGAESGRISSQNPNAQNIPSAERDPVYGKMIRSMFRVPKGRVLLEGDMSQQELRVLAMLSQDPVLIDAFKNKVDIHKATAAVVYGVPLEAVTKEQRTRSKTVTFGLIYGKTDYGLAQQLLITEDESKTIRKAVLGRYKQADKYMRETIAFAQEHGGVWTLWDGQKARWRPLPDIGLLGDDKGLHGRRFNATNASINTPIQGLAADFVTASLWPIVDMIVKFFPTARVVCTVHDSIMVECDEADAVFIAHEMKNVMQSHPSMGVPLEAEFKMGPSWGEMDTLHLVA